VSCVCVCVSVIVSDVWYMAIARSSFYDHFRDLRPTRSEVKVMYEYTSHSVFVMSDERVLDQRH
jgi:hypothetical protein